MSSCGACTYGIRATRPDECPRSVLANPNSLSLPICLRTQRRTPLATQLERARPRHLEHAVSGNGVAFRCCAKLQPAGGEGTKVFPPTYAGSVYATEKRRLPGTLIRWSVFCSTACRARPTGWRRLQQALDAGRIKIPVVEVDFTPYFPGDKQPDDTAPAGSRRQGQFIAGATPHRRRDPPR